MARGYALGLDHSTRWKQGRDGNVASQGCEIVIVACMVGWRRTVTFVC